MGALNTCGVYKFRDFQQLQDYFDVIGNLILNSKVES